MAYLAPSEFVTKMIDAGESKIFTSTRDTIIRAYMAGAILALAAWFAVTVNINVGVPIVGALLFPVVFCMLYKCPSPDNLRQVHCKPKVFVAGTRCDARLEAPRWPIGRPGESHDQIASSVGHWHARRASGRFYLRLRTIEVGGPFKAMVAKQDVWTEADRKSTRLNSSHIPLSRMPSSA